MLQILLFLHLLIHNWMKICAIFITYNPVFPIISIVQHIYQNVCRIPSTWHNSSTMNTTVEESCQRGKKDYLALNNHACECWKIVPATVEESCKRIQKHKMVLWYNVNIAAVLYFQITFYVQYQFHKVFLSVLTKAGRGGSKGTADPITSFSAF